MNFIYGLVLQACVVVGGAQQSCKDPVKVQIFETHNECAIAGYKYASDMHIREYFLIPKDSRLSVRFWCDPIKKQSI